MNENDDIVMEGNLIYRYSLDQIELEGQWAISSEFTKERYSYLLLKKASVIQCLINKKEIDFSLSDSSLFPQRYFSNDNFVVKICSANLFELLLIPNQVLFTNILAYLSGEYHGFFMYYGKTIEDKFNLNFSLENNQVRVTGDGSNNLGVFHILGYVNFYTMKEQLMANNDINSEVINLGELKVTRLYNAFNSSENNRVIKSFHHRRKKNDEDGDSAY